MVELATYWIQLADWNDANVTVEGMYEAVSMQAAICMAKNDHGWIRWTFHRGERITPTHSVSRKA